MSDETLPLEVAPAAGTFKNKRAVARTLFAAFLFPWIFDIRAVGNAWLLYVQLFSFAVTTVVFVLTVRTFKKRDTGLESFAGNKMSILVCSIFMIVAMFSGLLEHNETFKVFAFSTPMILFIYSLAFISIIAQAGVLPEEILDVFVLFSVAAILIRVPLIVAVYGADISNVRYQILCGATSVGTAYLIARAPAGLRPPEIVFALIQVAIIILSVTRTQILIVAVMGAAMLVAGMKRVLNLRVILMGIVGLPLLGLLIFEVARLLPGHQLDRWLTRTSSFQAGTADLSGLERLSQIVFQVQKLSGAGIEKFIGFGIAAPGGNYAPFEAYQATRGIHGMYSPIGFADNTYVSMLFLGGLIGAGPLLLAQFVWLWNSFKAIGFVLKAYPIKFSWMAMAPLAVISFQISNVLGASFADRGQSVFFGLCLGITGWMTAIRRRDMPKKITAPSPNRVAPPALESA